MKTKEVIDYLDLTFRPELQEDYDNSGFLLGDENSIYRGSLVALDLTVEVIEEAIREGVNLIVTHHPLIFSGIKRITNRNATGRMVQELIKHDIAVYAAHTNLDNLAWGVNGALADKLGLLNRSILHPIDSDYTTGAGMVGTLVQEESICDFLERVKKILDIPFLRTSPCSPQKKVLRVALCGGSGAFLIEDALHAGADVYITADLKYHDFQRTNPQMVLCDAGHYESEQFAKEVIFNTISGKFSNFACRISAVQKSLIRYI